MGAELRVSVRRAMKRPLEGGVSHGDGVSVTTSDVLGSRANRLNVIAVKFLRSNSPYSGHKDGAVGDCVLVRAAKEAWPKGLSMPNDGKFESICAEFAIRLDLSSIRSLRRNRLDAKKGNGGNVFIPPLHWRH